MFNKLQLDIIKRLIGPFLFCLLTILFLLLMQFLILHIDKLIGKGLDLFVIAELIALQLAYMLVLAVPMSILVASLMTFGKFAELSELTAVQAAGVKPMQLVRPVLLIALIMTVFLSWFSNEVLPEANFKARSLFLDIRMKKPGFDLKANSFYDGIDGYTFLTRDISSESDTLYDVTIFQDANDQRDQAVINAEYGILSGDQVQFSLKLDLYNGSVYRYLPDQSGTSNRIEESQFLQHRIRFDLSDMNFSRTNPDIRRRDDRTMSSRAMRIYADSLQSEIDRNVASLMNYHLAVGMIFNGTGHLNRSHTIDVFSEKMNQNDTRFGNRPQRFEPDSSKTWVAMSVPIYYESQTNLLTTASSNINSLENNLQNAQVNVKWRYERIAQFEVEILKKIAIPIGCIIFVLIGAPLGMLTKRGNLGYNAVLSTVLFTFYWISIIQGEKLADRLFISPFIGMWFGNIVLALLGILLMYKVTTDRRISDLWRSN
jgi:lipopolysaccharide export system permease protein